MSSLSLDKVCIGHCLRRKRLSEYDGMEVVDTSTSSNRGPRRRFKLQYIITFARTSQSTGNGRGAPHSRGLSPETLSRARSHHHELPDEL